MQQSLTQVISKSISQKTILNFYLVSFFLQGIKFSPLFGNGTWILYLQGSPLSQKSISDKQRALRANIFVSNFDSLPKRENTFFIIVAN